MSNKVVHIKIGELEAGQKLLAYLKRNLKNETTGAPLPQTLLHKLVRSGQIRVNSGRVQPYYALKPGDELRIPPLARVSMPVRDTANPGTGAQTDNGEKHRSVEADYMISPCLSEKYPDLQVIAESADYLALCKPAGLPVHGGTRHTDSVISRVMECAGQKCAFKPTLAHRLDKATSGVLLVAKSYKFLRTVQDSLANSAAHKIYLAWVKGAWVEPEGCLLEDYLVKRKSGQTQQIERVEVTQGPKFSSSSSNAEQGAYCVSRVTVIGENATASLLKIELLTGRTHQIRVQLSSRGFAIIGDHKYGGIGSAQGMLLHSWRFVLPGFEDVSFEALPAWHGKYKVLPQYLKSAK